MSDTTHDPPAGLSGLPIDKIPLPPEQLARLSGPSFDKYTHMRDRLGVEPLAAIAWMRRGGYRYKSQRGKPGVLVMRRGEPVPDAMSFRQIAPILTELSGVPVTYETIRRWWEIVFPGEAVDEPDLTPVPVPRVVRRRTPAVGDEHAGAIRAAVERAKAPTTNPDVPAAAFLPPDQETM